MNIFINPIQNNQNQRYSPLFVPSFKMTKSDLGVFNTYVFEKCFPAKQKPDIQKFKVIDEFYNSCKNYLSQIIPSNFYFGGRQEETKIQRKAMMTEWFNYVTKENDAYTGAIQLMILKSITKDLDKNNDKLPPVLNKGILANTVTEVQEELNKDEKVQPNFDKKYRLNLQKGIFAEEKTLDKNLNGWIVIPSKEHDDEKKFKQNVDKLTMLSHRNWCTSSFNAKPYLEQGDFHVYMENGNPKLGVRFVGDEIQEIQGELNDSKIPVKYGTIVKEHIKSYGLRANANRELKKLEATEAKIERIKAKLPERINNTSTQEILEALGIKCRKDSDSLLIISNYGDSTLDYSYSDLGIDENRLFKDIKVIEGNADFKGSQVTNLGNLESIGGSAVFTNSQVTSLESLKSIGGSAVFTNSQVTSLESLKSIGGSAVFSNSQLTDLRKLESIGGSAYFRDSQVTSLGSLKSIGGIAHFEKSQVADLGNLESIGGYAYFIDSQVTDLGNLKSIGGDAYIWGALLKKSDFDSIKVGGEVIAG